ncbi:MAG: hypothetical protein ACRDZ4_11520 [Egibacteraceae bacterium]
MAKKGRPLPLAEDEMLALLKTRYPAPSWALIPQVGNRTGGWSRCADAVGMSCWPSLGLSVHGFECKSRRADFLDEIRNGEKSQAIFQFCDYWWVVAAGDKIVGPGELPPTWGLLVAKGGRLHVEKEAPPLKPKPLTKEFLASVLRNSLNIVTPDSKIEAGRKAGYDEGYEAGINDGKYRRESAEKEVANLRAAICTFEQAAGVEFPKVTSYWPAKDEAERFGRAVRLVMDGDRDRALRQLQGLKDNARQIMESVDRALAEADAVIPLPVPKQKAEAEA